MNLITYSKVNHPTKTASAISKKSSSSNIINYHQKRLFFRLASLLTSSDVITITNHVVNIQQKRLQSVPCKIGPYEYLVNIDMNNVCSFSYKKRQFYKSLPSLTDQLYVSPLPLLSQLYHLPSNTQLITFVDCIKKEHLRTIPF